METMEQMMVCMLAKMEAKIKVNNEKSEVLRGTLISQMDAHQAKIEDNHKELITTIKASQEGDGSSGGCQSRDGGGLPRKDGGDSGKNRNENE
jgi:hypothetical protein